MSFRKLASNQMAAVYVIRTFKQFQ